MLHQPSSHFFLVAMSLVWLFAASIGAQGEESRTSQSPSVTMQADGAVAQNFAEFLKAEEQATKHASDIIEHALAVFTWIVGVVGGLLVSGAALLGWAIALWSRASKTDIQDEVKKQLQGRVTEAIELESKETQRRITQLSKETDEFTAQLAEAKNRVNLAENTLSKQQDTINKLVIYSLAEIIYRELLWKIGHNMDVKCDQTPDQQRWLRLLFDHGLLTAKDWSHWIPFDEIRVGANLSEIFAPTPAAEYLMESRGLPIPIEGAKDPVSTETG
jgi:hypothetical protein